MRQSVYYLSHSKTQGGRPSTLVMNLVIMVFMMQDIIPMRHMHCNVIRHVLLDVAQEQ